MLTGKKIAEFRIKNNITQSELSQKLFVSQQLVSAWENGLRRPDYSSLKRMALLFGVDIAELYSFDDVIFDELSSCIPSDLSLDFNQLKQFINSFLSTLTEKERFVFVRRYYFTDSFSFIAEKINIKENQARTVLSRVRKKFTKYLLEVTS